MNLKREIKKIYNKMDKKLIDEDYDLDFEKIEKEYLKKTGIKFRTLNGYNNKKLVNIIKSLEVKNG